MQRIACTGVNQVRRLAVIANKSAGQGGVLQTAFRARSQLWGRHCDFFYPNTISEIRSICSQIDPDQYDGCVVMGGDGTFNQVIRAHDVLPNKVPLFAFPCGTANDLAKELGLQANWNQVQALMDQQAIKRLDLVEVNGFPFVTVGGLGIGARLTSDFNAHRSKSKMTRILSSHLHSQIYTYLSAKTILFKNNYIHRLRIQAPDFDEQVRTPAVFLCNQTFLGGGLRVAPKIDNTDTRFNVLIVTTCTKAKLLNSMARLKAGVLPPNFFVFSTDSVLIEDLDGRPIQVFGDGETLCSDSKLKVRILPKKLLVFQEGAAQ